MGGGGCTARSIPKRRPICIIYVQKELANINMKRDGEENKNKA
jgi:hypothetical protein